MRPLRASSAQTLSGVVMYMTPLTTRGVDLIETVRSVATQAMVN